ncbi:MAG: hypothetical protein GY853_16605 [PVC group bacterium]|nr:hypothetical protein [PVC group bacterium]
MVSIKISLDDESLKDTISEIILESEEIFDVIRKALNGVDIEINLDLDLIIESNDSK